MSGYLGMNPSQVEQLISVLNEQAGKIDGIKSRLAGSVSSTTWDGADAEKFKSDWTSVHANNLQRVADALREISTKARNELSQQQSTSSH